LITPLRINAKDKTIYINDTYNINLITPLRINAKDENNIIRG
jgi:hypothetical protein